jgi:hypothetical protein
MAKPGHAVSRHRLIVMVGIVLLAGGLLALWFPVLLGDHDMYGVQIKCGNGYSSQLLQATVDDQGPGQQSASGAAPTAVRPPTNHVDQCKGALAHRRAWAIPAAGLGALLLIPEAVMWARSRATEPVVPGSTIAWRPSAHPDENMHDAAVLDRRERSHREPPSNTTL